METMIINGSVDKSSFYGILAYVDSLKVQGWYITKRTRTESNNMVEFHYTMSKKSTA